MSRALAHWFPLEETNGNTLRNATSGDIAKLQAGKLTSVDRDGKSKALKLDGRTAYACGQAPELRHNQPFSFTGWVKIPKSSGGAIFSRMDVANNYRGYDFWVQGRNIGTHIISTWPSNAIKVVSADQLKPNTWHHVVMSYDGSLKAAGVKIYIDGKLSKNKVEQDSLSATIETKVPFKIGSRSSGANFTGEVDDLRIYDRAIHPA